MNQQPMFFTESGEFSEKDSRKHLYAPLSSKLSVSVAKLLEALPVRLFEHWSYQKQRAAIFAAALESAEGLTLEQAWRRAGKPGEFTLLSGGGWQEITVE